LLRLKCTTRVTNRDADSVRTSPNSAMARRYNDYKRGRGKPGGEATCGDAHHPQGSLAHKRADAKRKGETRLGGPPTDPETVARLLPVPAPLAIRLRTRQPAAQRKGPRERAGGGRARGGHSAGGTAAALGRIAGADAPPLLRRTHTQHNTHARAACRRAPCSGTGRNAAATRLGPAAARWRRRGERGRRRCRAPSAPRSAMRASSRRRRRDQCRASGR